MKFDKQVIADYRSVIGERNLGVLMATLQSLGPMYSLLYVKNRVELFQLAVVTNQTIQLLEEYHEILVEMGVKY